MLLSELYKPKLPLSLRVAGDNYFRDLVMTEPEDEDWRLLQDKLVDKMYKKGWNALQDSLYSLVFVHPNKKYIWKINKQLDRGYAYFVKLVKANPNPHFPVVSDIMPFKFEDEVYYQYAIEKLYTPPDTQKLNQIISSFHKIIWNPHKSWKK